MSTYFLNFNIHKGKGVSSKKNTEKGKCLADYKFLTDPVYPGLFHKQPIKGVNYIK